MGLLSALAISISILVLHTHSQSFEYIDFQALPGITLPVPIHEHISAIYNDKLFIIGGLNGTSSDSFSTTSWSLDLLGLSLELSSTTNNDIDRTSVGSPSWVELDITPPTYGTLDSKKMRCQNQCYTQTGQYLWIIGALNTDSPTASSLSIYRLDLSQSPPTFASETDIVNTLGSGGADLVSGSFPDTCVASSADGAYVYVVGGAALQERKYFLQYDVTQNQWSALTDMNLEREAAGCAVNYNDEEVYILGGFEKGTNGASYINTIDWYSADTQTWTDNQDDLSAATIASARGYFKCWSNGYDQTIICPGGKTTGDGRKTTDLYRTPTKEFIKWFNLNTAVASSGLNAYEFVNDGQDQASVLLVTGGYIQFTTTGGISDEIQYIVAYNVPTPAPTGEPTTDPTMAPSTAPTQPPTRSPSMAPTQPPTAAPTKAPTVSPPPTTPEPEATRVGTAKPKTTEPFGYDNSDHCNRINVIIGVLISMLVCVWNI